MKSREALAIVKVHHSRSPQLEARDAQERSSAHQNKHPQNGLAAATRNAMTQQESATSPLGVWSRLAEHT